MDFTQLVPVGARDIDHCFGGWDGHATIAYPSSGVRLAFECDPVFGHVVVYTPPGKPFFAVEPVTHANDGFNLFAAGQPDNGIRVLQPGEALQGTFRLRVLH
jgi:aldose 1-epimerase